MDFLKGYITNINVSINNNVNNTNTGTGKNTIDCYKIIAVNDKNTTRTFLFNDHKNLCLTSKTLIKMLMLNMLPDGVLDAMLIGPSKCVKKYIECMRNVSSILAEDRIFFNFDPYNNFLLGNNKQINHIKDIIANTTTYHVRKTSRKRKNKEKEYDFSEMVNPYGLEKVVFTGGGVKGLIYIGAFFGLMVTGQLFYLNHFAGSSVGALTAMIAGCVTPPNDEYDMIRELSLRDILTRAVSIVERYREAVTFAMERFCKRNIDSFYTPPTYTMYGIWTAVNTVIKQSGLYDPQKSGFQIWYAIICKKLCHIMKNGLDNLILIKKPDGSYVELTNVPVPVQPPSNEAIEANDDYVRLYKEYCGGVDIDTESFIGWELVRFFSFREYNQFTKKTLVLTGTNTKPLDTVYYTHTNRQYKELSVMTGAMASISIPFIFKAPIINNSYNLDGGIFNNYPLTHCDRKIKEKITHYNNKIFGYLIDDKNSIIDAYEIIRELWIVYNGFIDITNAAYMSESSTYCDISQLFFEIRAEIYKLLYFTDIELESFLNRQSEHARINGFNIMDLENINMNVGMLKDHENKYSSLQLPKVGAHFIVNHLSALDSHYRQLDSIFKIGKKTDIADVMELSIKHGEAYNMIIDIVQSDLLILENMDQSDEIVLKYQKILQCMTENILVYYELKGNFIRCDDFKTPSVYFVELMKSLYKKIIYFETMTDNAIDEINKLRIKRKEASVTNALKSSIQIIKTMVSKILTGGTGNNIDNNNVNQDNDRSSYMKAIDYITNADITGILYKYICIVNDRICDDSFNRMRTIKLNTFETNTLHFDMDDELKSRLIYEGYSKTIQYFTSLLNIMEITDRFRSSDEYIESFELRYKSLV